MNEQDVEYRYCGECCEEWQDTGDTICRFCKSEDTWILNPDFDEED